MYGRFVFLGLALSEFKPYATNTGTIIRPSGGPDPTVYFDMTVLNVGEDIPAPADDTNDIFNINVYISPQANLDDAILLPSESVTIGNAGPRNIAMRMQTAVKYSGMSVQFPRPASICVGK